MGDNVCFGTTAESASVNWLTVELGSTDPQLVAIDGTCEGHGHVNLLHIHVNA